MPEKREQMNNWIVANWKMNGSKAHVAEFVPALLAGLPETFQAGGTRVAICPPHPYLVKTGEMLAGSGVALGAQKVHPMPSGAFTGEISPTMLTELGVSLCLIGHSEHRHHFGVTDAIIAQKLHALIAEDITPILCVGETLAEREAGKQEETIATQVRRALDASDGEGGEKRAGEVVLVPHPRLPESSAAKLVIAYEPVWAIGTGHTATPEQADAMHRFIRGIIEDRYSQALASEMPILYGGSVNAENAGELLSLPEINGALVGGASLKADSFLTIINQALV